MTIVNASHSNSSLTTTTTPLPTAGTNVIISRAEIRCKNGFFAEGFDEVDCVNSTIIAAPEPTDLSEIPAKEIIIVILMLSLWLYSIVLTRKAWYRILKE